ncbi:unnamed protein product [Moneuplotes crassus]|uniref:USP domain-containing protein n=1 Tax=Euplotes crassus TaxID=5936 RepID=A0AAD2DC72_EUPCR|nr:unnamed protein product [Moneuplotes crassus]
MNESGIPSIHPKLLDVKDNSEVMDFLESTIRETELARLEQYEHQRKNIAGLLKKENHSLDGYFDRLIEMCKREMAKAHLYYDLQSKLNQALRQTSTKELVNAIAEGLQRGKEWDKNYKQEETLTLCVIYSIGANVQKIQSFNNFDDLEKGIEKQGSTTITENSTSDAPTRVNCNKSTEESTKEEETNVTGSNDCEQNKACIEEVKDQNKHSNKDSNNITTILKESSDEGGTRWREEELCGNPGNEILKERNKVAEDAPQWESLSERKSQNEEGEEAPNPSQDDSASCGEINVDPNVTEENLSSDNDSRQSSLGRANNNVGNDEVKLETPQPNLNEKSDLSCKSSDISVCNEEASQVVNKGNAPQESCAIRCLGSTRKGTEHSEEDTKSNDSSTSDRCDEQKAKTNQKPEASSTDSDGEGNPGSNELGPPNDVKNNASDCSELENNANEPSAFYNQNDPETSVKQEIKIQKEQFTSEKISSENKGGEDSQPDQANDESEASESQQEKKEDSSDDIPGDNINGDKSGPDSLATSGEIKTVEDSDTSDAREESQEEIKHEKEDNYQNGEIEDVNDEGNDSDRSEEQKNSDNEDEIQEDITKCSTTSKEEGTPKEAYDNQISKEDTQKALEIPKPDSSTSGEEPLAQDPSVYNTNGVPQDNTEESSKEGDTTKVMGQPGNSECEESYFEVFDVEVQKFSEIHHPSQKDHGISRSGKTEDKEENKVSEEDSKEGSGEHSQNSETVEKEKLDDDHKEDGPSNVEEVEKAANSKESEGSDCSLKKELLQDSHLNEKTLEDTNNNTVEESKGSISSCKPKCIQITLEAIPNPALKNEEVADLESQKCIRDEGNNFSDVKHNGLNNKKSEEISQKNDTNFSGFNEEDVKSDFDEESKENTQNSCENDKKFSITSQTSEDNISKVDHTSWTDNESSKNVVGEYKEGLNQTQDIQNLGSSNEDKSVTGGNVDALDKSLDEQTPTNKANNNSNEFGEQNQKSDENSPFNIDHQPTNPNYSGVDDAISEEVQANIPRDSFSRSNLSENSEGNPELDDQEPSDPNKDPHTDQVLNIMISESTGVIGNTNNGSSTLEGVDKDFDGQSTKEGMIEDKEHVVSLLQGKSDSPVIEQTNSLEADKPTLNDDDNPVPDERMDGSVEDKMESLGSVAHSQCNSFRTQKVKPQQIIDDDNSKLELKTGIQNNDFQKEEIHKHQEDQSNKQNEEINTTLPQRDIMNDPNYEKNKHKDWQNCGNSLLFSSHESSSKAENAPNPMNTSRKGHQNDPLSIPETEYHHQQNSDTKNDLSQEGYNQYQKSPHEDYDDSKCGDDEFHSCNDEEDQSETDKDPSSQIDPNYNPFDNDEEYKLPQEVALNENDLWFVHPGFQNNGNNCFMNSILQMLLSIPEFVIYFVDAPLPELSACTRLYYRGKLKVASFTEEMNKLRVYCYERNHKIIMPNLLRKLSEDEFPIGEQNDACKYMLHLFENLQNESDPSVPHFVSSGYENYAEAWMKYQEDHYSIIDQLFVGMYETVISCNKCNDKTRNYEEFINVPLTIETDDKGSKSLEFFENQKEISPSKYYCSKCELITSCAIFKRICKAPKYLMLSIQRFDDFTQEKDNDHVHYPPTFRLELPGKKKAVYDLKSVVCHSGGLEFGHYLAFCKRGRYWRDYNDEYVEYSNIYRATNEDAYMLAYKIRYYE